MKKISYIQIALALLMTLFLSQCYYDQIVYEEPELPDDIEVSFLNEIIPIFNASCNTSGCHNTGGIAPDLSPSKAYNALISGNYIDLDAPENSELYQWMAGNRGLSMPISGPNAIYNATVLQWIKQGAKNN